MPCIILIELRRQWESVDKVNRYPIDINVEGVAINAAAIAMCDDWAKSLENGFLSAIGAEIRTCFMEEVIKTTKYEGIDEKSLNFIKVMLECRDFGKKVDFECIAT